MVQVGFLSIAALVASAAAVPAKRSCDKIHVRRDWNNLHGDEKASFLGAIKCMMQKPTISINGIDQVSRFEDYTYIHQYPGYAIHWVARFLPWHRWFVYAYHQELQECGYEGAMPYWAWEQDYQDLSASNIWNADPEIGFGTYGNFDYNNVYNATVITDGAFANHDINFPFPHKLTRNLPSSANLPWDGPGPYAQRGYNPEAMQNLTNIATYKEFSVLLESPDPLHNPSGIPGSHGAIHLSLSADMASNHGNNSSPNDPLFYMHHSNIDRIWSSWQALDEKHLYDYEGNTDFYWSTGMRSGLPASLDDPLLYGEANALGSENLKIKDVMDTTEWPLCYTYEDLEPWVFRG